MSTAHRSLTPANELERPKTKEAIMLRTYLLLALAGALFVACGSEPTEPDNPAAILIPNFSERNQVVQENGETGQLMQGLNYSTGSSLASGSGVLLQPSGLGSGQTYFATLTPTTGNPDLYRYSRAGFTLLYRAQSSNTVMLTDRLSGTGFLSSDYFYVVSNGGPSGFAFSVSWEANGRLELDVPYFNQYDIPKIGPSACASASTAMVMAYYAKIKVDKNTMIGAAQACFSKTSSPDKGLLAPQPLVDHVKDVYGFTGSTFQEYVTGTAANYAAIQAELRAGRPVLLSSRAVSPAGHFIVVTGFNGNDYKTATIIVNDSNGRWQGCAAGHYCYNERQVTKGVEYSFATVTSLSGRIYFVR